MIKNKTEKKTIHIICGPTASGKSAKAIKLATETNGVIINADSMQIYDDLPMLTAQPSAEERANIPHKLYAHLHPNDACSAGHYREMVIPIITETLENGQTPVICGGTGLYIKALMEGLSPMPDIPQDIRDASIAAWEEMGEEKFYIELTKRDPIMAARFHMNHKARILRAWEVLEATGKSLAEWQELPREAPPKNWEFKVHKIMPERETLRKRCDLRFDWMIENGALNEVKEFAARIESGEINHNIPLKNALGFNHLRAYLNNEMSLNEATEKSKAATRQYAKRQVTWFRGQL